VNAGEKVIRQFVTTLVRLEEGRRISTRASNQDRVLGSYELGADIVASRTRSRKKLFGVGGGGTGCHVRRDRSTTGRKCGGEPQVPAGSRRGNVESKAV
jgi:hypothetical protein